MDWEAFYNRFREPDFVPGYEIQNRLGGGAFGEVYKARKHSIGKAYAIKFLKIDDDSQREAVERELEQVRHFAAIDHPNLVTIEDLGTVMGVPYLVMGYAGEDTLARMMRRERMAKERALLYFVQACRGVLALHDRRLAHFDLKPSNIFIKGDIARVGDYGLSKMMADGRLTLSFGRGTPQYMAPEMIRNRADHRADIYSLGVILYESVAGILPYQSDVPGTVPVREDDRPPAFPPDFPAEQRRVVERCLRLSPDDRYPSLAELIEDLGATARPGDSVLLGWQAAQPHKAPPPAPARPEVLASKAPSSAPDDRSEARNTAAEITRGAVEVARGMWDGLRSPVTNPRVPPLAATPTPVREAVVMHALTTTNTALAPIANRNPALALDLHPVLGPGLPSVVAHASAGAQTIPVPPRAETGLFGTAYATLRLATEVLVSLARGILRGISGGFSRRGRAANITGETARGASRIVVGLLRLLVFVAALALLGALVTLGVVLVASRS